MIAKAGKWGNKKVGSFYNMFIISHNWHTVYLCSWGASKSIKLLASSSQLWFTTGISYSHR